MNLIAILIVAGLFLTYSLFSKYLEKTILTAPLIFTVVGLLTAYLGNGLLGISDLEHGTIHILVELTLVIVLFTDAAQTNFQILEKQHFLPQRMLLIGLPLIIILGTLAGYLIFDKFNFWEVALLAAILAPTDAALAKPVVSSEDLPLRIRQIINVESGLNDGIALPAVLIFASCASSFESDQSSLYFVKLTLSQIILGPLVGMAVGYVGAKSINFFSDKKWMSQTFEGIGALSIALIAFSGATLVGGNGFLSAFVGGLAFGHFLNKKCEFLYEFAESEGQFFTLTTFLVFGAAAVHLIGDEFQWSYIFYAVLSLTIIRMLPIAISLIGTGVDKYTVLFLGWFGPRGLASILFTLLVLENMNIAHSGELTSVIMITVLMSIVLHGITAFPVSRKYGSIIKHAEETEETKSTEKSAA